MTNKDGNLSVRERLRRYSMGLYVDRPPTIDEIKKSNVIVLTLEQQRIIDEYKRSRNETLQS